MDAATVAMAATAVACFLGSLIGGLCAIGGYMIIIPVMALFVPVRTAILVCCLAGPFLSGMLLLHYRKDVSLRAIAPMLAGALPGILAGVQIIRLVPGGILQLILGLTLCGFLLWQCFGGGARGRDSMPLGCAAGFASGLLGASVSVSGPPVGAYGLYASWSRQAFLGNLGAFYFIHAVGTCVAQAAAGLYSEDVVILAAWGVPAGILGTLLTFPLVKRINVAQFRRLVMGIILAAALSSLHHAWKYFMALP